MRQSPPAAAAQLSSSRRHLPFTKSSPAGTMTGSHISAPTHTFLTLGPAVNPMMRLAPPPGNRKGSLPLQRPREVVAVAVPPAGPITRSRPEHVVRRNHRGHLLQHSFMSQNAHTPRASQASDAHSRRYSENQLITTRSRFPKHYVSNRASSLNGHETVQIGKSVSGYSLPQMTVWGLEEEEDEFGEDSEGTLDPIEVLESLYQEVPLPPWVNVATADDSYPRQGAASPARGKRSPSPLINSVPPSPERSYSPKNASRSPLSFSMAARLRRNSLVGNGTEKKSRDGDDDDIPIHQRPLPPVPSSQGSSNSLRQRLLRARRASDVPKEPQVPEEDQPELPSPAESSLLVEPVEPVEHDTRSVVNHIIPPEERAQICHQRRTSGSSISSRSSAPSVQTLQTPSPPIIPPTSPFGSSTNYPLKGLTPPPRPRVTIYQARQASLPTSTDSIPPSLLVRPRWGSEGTPVL